MSDWKKAAEVFLPTTQFARSYYAAHFSGSPKNNTPTKEDIGTAIEIIAGGKARLEYLRGDPGKVEEIFAAGKESMAKVFKELTGAKDLIELYKDHDPMEAKAIYEAALKNPRYIAEKNKVSSQLGGLALAEFASRIGFNLDIIISAVSEKINAKMQDEKQKGQEKPGHEGKKKIEGNFQSIPLRPEVFKRMNYEGESVPATSIITASNNTGPKMPNLS